MYQVGIGFQGYRVFSSLVLLCPHAGHWSLWLYAVLTVTVMAFAACRGGQNRKASVKVMRV